MQCLTPFGKELVTLAEKDGKNQTKQSSQPSTHRAKMRGKSELVRLITVLCQQRILRGL